MRLYICIDGSFAGTQEDAKAKGKGFSLTEVPTDKAGLIDYLNGMVDEARGSTATPLFPAAEPPKPIMSAQPSYAAQSVRFEDEFAAMPIATQLHYAALAMENARAAL